MEHSKHRHRRFAAPDERVTRFTIVDPVYIDFPNPRQDVEAAFQSCFRGQHPLRWVLYLQRKNLR